MGAVVVVVVLRSNKAGAYAVVWHGKSCGQRLP